MLLFPPCACVDDVCEKRNMCCMLNKSTDFLGFFPSSFVLRYVFALIYSGSSWSSSALLVFQSMRRTGWWRILCIVRQWATVFRVELIRGNSSTAITIFHCTRIFGYVWMNEWIELKEVHCSMKMLKQHWSKEKPLVVSIVCLFLLMKNYRNRS